MRTAALLAGAASLISVPSARINGFAAPTRIAPDTDIRLTITTENYIQSTEDVALSFGLYPTNISYPTSLGSLLSSKFLGPDFSNTLDNITHIVHIPSTVEKGVQYTLSGAHFTLVGAVDSPSIVNYAVNVTVGDYASSDYVAASLLLQ